MTEVRVRERRTGDDAEWLRMRCALWPEDPPEEHRKGMRDWLAHADTVTLVAERPGGAKLAGFAEVGTRPYADGCASTPVAYLEGWYVDADVRRQGVGARLVEAAEAWARARGLSEFASDALLENDTSHRAHLELGFEEVERAVRYRKLLGEPSTAAPVTVETLKAFLDAFNRHDLDAIMGFFADECEFYMPRGEGPRGDRYVGKPAVRAGLAKRFEGIPDVHYGEDVHWVVGSLGVSEWTLTGTSVKGESIRVRGVDLLEFAGGLIVRKDSFWKIVG